MLSLMKHLIQREPRTAGMFVLAAASLALVPLAHADGVMNEQDINAQSVTNALAPDDGGDAVLTRGFVLSKPADGSAGAPVAEQEAQARPARHGRVHAVKAKAHAANMLITFESNSITLTPGAQTALDQVATALQSDRLSAYKFRVEGNADPRGPADANMKLSQDRAAAVVDYLTQKGVAAERLTAIGKGSSDLMNRRNPAAPENRRVTIVTVTD